jgi:DNA-binding transcriptional regulator YiaG
MPVIDHETRMAKKQPRTKRAPKIKVFGTPDKPGIALALRNRLQLNQTVFAQLIPLSVRSLATLEKGTPPTEVVARKLNELKRLVNALSEVIKKDSLGTWLQTPNEAFGGLKPLEVIDRGESDRIWSMIHFLRSGEPS